MNETLTITINGEQYSVKFGYGCFRLLTEKWGLRSVQSVFSEFANMDGRELDLCIDLVWAAIKAAGREVDIDAVGDLFLFNQAELARVMQVFMASFPKAEPEGKGKAPKLTGQKQK